MPRPRRPIEPRAANSVPQVPDQQPYHLTPDDFRERAAAVADWVASYHERLDTLPVQPVVEPGAVRRLLPATAPEHPEPFDAVLADLDRIVLPHVTGWQAPGWFAYFPANSTGPAILGDLVSSGLGQQGMLWSTSPACTELETHVLDWLIDLLGLPERFRSTGAGGGVIEDSASSATLCALVAARDRARRAGASLAALRAYVSEHAHSSVAKAARIAGLADAHVRVVASDAAHALRPDALAETMAADEADGLVPFFVTATAGTTSSLAFDPVAAIADVTDDAGAWLHVDAAMAGSAAVCPELRWVNDGLERADSYVFNPHKWLFTTFDCSCFYVADRSALVDALGITPEYLRNTATEAGEVIDYRDWQVPLGRRFRSLKLWFVVRHYGAEGLRHHVREHVRLAGLFAERVGADDRLVLAAPQRLNLVCFRHRGGDDATAALLADLNATGEVFLTHTRLDGRYVIRVSIGSWTTEARHVDHLWTLVDRLAGEHPS